MSKFKLALIVIAGLVVAGVASAALVTILSNTATVTADVTNPVRVLVDGEEVLPVEAVGNDTITLDITTENLSNNPISGISTTVIGGTGLTGEEITKILRNGIDRTASTCVVDEAGALTTLAALTNTYSQITLLFYGDDNLDCTGTASTNDVPAETIETDVIDITLHQAVAPGTYTVSSNYVNDLSGSASVVAP